MPPPKYFWGALAPPALPCAAAPGVFSAQGSDSSPLSSSSLSSLATIFCSSSSSLFSFKSVTEKYSVPLRIYIV